MIQFDSVADFIAMGGYSAYVWGAFGATFLCMAGLTLHTLWVRKALRSEALRQIARAERIQQDRAAKRAARAQKAQDLNSVSEK